MMEIKKAERKRAKLKIGIASPSGGGKTYSALLMAKGLVGKWNKICVIDTENDSASLYSDLSGKEPSFDVLNLTKPFTPQRYCEALATAEKAGYECIIIDSISHEWSGAGGELDIVESHGGKFTDWAKVTPHRRKFLDAILQTETHVICTSRTKSDWVVEANSKGKSTPRKVGTKAEQKEGVEYELTLAFRLAQNNHATCEKDRTGLFYGCNPFVISEETGRKLIEWSTSGKKPAVFDPKNETQMKFLEAYVKSKDVPYEKMPEIGAALIGKEFSKSTIQKAVGEYL